MLSQLDGAIVGNGDDSPPAQESGGGDAGMEELEADGSILVNAPAPENQTADPARQTAVPALIRPSSKSRRAARHACKGLEVVGHVPPEVSEASGIAASFRHPGVYYAVPDSPEQLQLVAIEETGKTVGTFTLTGVDLPAGFAFGQHGTGDLEALAVGPCSPGAESTCIFVGDVGYNCIRRPVDPRGVKCIWHRPQGLYSIMRFEEPADLAGGAAELRGERFWFRFPDGDGPYDVETLLVAPSGALYLVNKVESGLSGFYSIPPLTSSRTVIAKRLAEVPLPDGPANVSGYFKSVHPARLFTGSSIRVRQPSGDSAHAAGEVLEVTLLTYRYILHYPVAGNFSSAQDVARAFAQEPRMEEVPYDWQAEALTWSYPDAGSYLVVGEKTPIGKADCSAAAGGSSCGARVAIALLLCILMPVL